MRASWDKFSSTIVFIQRSPITWIFRDIVLHSLFLPKKSLEAADFLQGLGIGTQNAAGKLAIANLSRELGDQGLSVDPLEFEEFWLREKLPESTAAFPAELNIDAQRNFGKNASHAIAHSVSD